MQLFKIFDISGDAGITAFGRTIEEAFVNAAIGMYSLITDIDKVRDIKSVDIIVESQSLEGLVVSWLNELIFHFDTYGFIGKKIVLNDFKKNKLKASVFGEEFDPERHKGKLLIKAATYHKLRIEDKNGIWEIDVIFDV